MGNVKKITDKLCESIEERLRSMNDDDYVDACDEVSSWFDGSAEARRHEMERDRKHS